MAPENKLIEEVSLWLRLYDAGYVDRSWIGPPELKFMIDPVPSHPDQFINGVATRDVFSGPPSNLKMRIYLPEVKPENDDPKLPILLHFHGGGFCISQPDEVYLLPVLQSPIRHDQSYLRVRIPATSTRRSHKTRGSRLRETLVVYSL